MRSQSGDVDIARQLLALYRQAHALQLTPSQIVRFGHGAPPLTIDAGSSHSIAGPVGGPGHGRQGKYWQARILKVTAGGMPDRKYSDNSLRHGHGGMAWTRKSETA
jgi:hypothetical protein